MRLLGWLAVAVVVLACTRLDAMAPAGCLAPSLEVTPSNLDLFEDSTGSVAAEVTTNCGASVVDTALVAWVTRNAGVATVAAVDSLSATVTAVAIGETYIVATFGAATDSARITVQALTPADTFPCTGTPTKICPGDDGQAKIDAQGTGTAFTVGAGIHRLQSWVPKANDTFRFEVGAVMDGGRTLTGWTAAGTAYYVGGQTQQNPYGTTYVCAAGHPGCGYPEQLWVNGHYYEHMTTLGAIGAGKWYFDYAADRIYLPFDPTDSTVVTTVEPYAFSGGASGVVIKGPTGGTGVRGVIEHYAAGPQRAVVGYGSAPGWTVDTMEVRHSGGIGIRTTGTANQRGNYVHHMSEMGAAATGTPTSRGNKWEYNNTAGFGPGGAEENGGVKWVYTSNMLSYGDTARYNYGNGLWFDTNNRDATLRKFVADSNDWAGVLDEVSYRTLADSGKAWGNGRNPPGSYAVAGANIIVANSRDAEIAYNVVGGGLHGILGYETTRSAPVFPSGESTHDVVNLDVHHNTITVPAGGRAAGIADLDAGANPYSAGNTWHHNAYTCLGGAKWRWTGNTDITKAAWVALPQDASSTFSGC